MDKKDRKDILKRMKLGDSVAENEKHSLSGYFVETGAWDKLFGGETDIVYGAKGTGKSALYLLLMDKSKDLTKQGVHVIAGEEVESDPVFKSINDGEDVPSESYLRSLWKVYILTLVGNHLFNLKQQGRHGNKRLSKVIKLLQEAKLVPLDGLSRYLRSASAFVSRFKPTVKSPDGWEASLVLDEPTIEEEDNGKVSVKMIMSEIDELLSELGIEIWLLFDRLDVAFTEPEVEEPALRALFRVYRDMAGLNQIKLKIFLRNDIWERITIRRGFREQSHITNTHTLSWDEEALRHLLLKRFFNNSDLENMVGMSMEAALSSPENQEIALKKIFPAKVETGPNKPTTFRWILGRIRDGKNLMAPREMIGLVEAARKEQIHKEEVGGVGSGKRNHLISGAALKAAHKVVSKLKVETLYSEFPDLRKYLEAFEGKRSEYNIASLENLFKAQGVLDKDVEGIVRRLVDIGFLEKKSRKGVGQTYWIPFLFRPQMNLIMGSDFD